MSASNAVSRDSREQACAVVTGASSGIGAAVAEKLAKNNFRLVLTARRREQLEAIAEQIGRRDDVRIVVGDIRDAATIERVIAAAVETWNRVDVLVNNAGIVQAVPIAEVTADLLLNEMQTNTFGHAALIAKAWPIFCRQRQGVIVNISSLAAVDPLPGFLSYGASKAALESLARSAAREGRDLGIRAFNIEPGAVATPLLSRLFGESAPQVAISSSVIADVVLSCIQGHERDASEGSIRVNG